MKKTIFIFFYTLLLVGYFSMSQCVASVSLGVYPPITTIHTIAPTSVTSSIRFFNSSDSPIDGSVRIIPFLPSQQQDGLPLYQEKFTGPDADIAHKLSLSLYNQPVSDLTLPPQSTRDITLTINLPDDEPDADYYFSIVFMSKGNKSDQYNSSSVAVSLASHILLTIGHGNTPQGFIEDFSVPFFVTHGPLPFTLRIANTGNTFFAPQAAITIHNMFGQTVGVLPLLPVNILAKSSRSLPSSVESTTTQQSPPVWNEKVLFGIYTADVQVALSAQGPLFHQTRYIVALPWYALIIICILSLIGLFIFLRVKKRVT